MKPIRLSDRRVHSRCANSLCGGLSRSRPSSSRRGANIFFCRASRHSTIWGDCERDSRARCPAAAGQRVQGVADACLMAYVPLGFRVLRTIRPILRFGNTIVVTRYDDVREVFLNDAAFRVPYKDKLDIIMGGHPFFLSMDDTPEYRRDTAAMRLVVRPADITERLAGEVERRAEHIVATAKGHLEIVDSLVRR